MKIFIAALVIIISGFAMGVLSFDHHRRLVDDVVLVRDGDQKFLQLEFNAPVRLVGQYPKTSGDILQVKLRPVAVGAFDENLSLLEKFVGEEEGKEIHMTQMQYEGNVPGGPFLVMKFEQPVKWKIIETDGLLGMNIIVGEV